MIYSKNNLQNSGWDGCVLSVVVGNIGSRGMRDCKEVH